MNSAGVKVGELRQFFTVSIVIIQIIYFSPKASACFWSSQKKKKVKIMAVVFRKLLPFYLPTKATI